MQHIDNTVILNHICHRRSVPASQLAEPAPNDEQLEKMLLAANSAPDHGNLTPWRYIIIRGEHRFSFGDMLAEALKLRNPDATEADIERERQKATRAPLIIAVVANPVMDHPKVPVIEQILAAGTAAGYLLLAADAMGFGSIWLTGPRCYDEHVKRNLGLAPHESLIGLINIGTPKCQPEARRRPQPSQFITEWRGVSPD